MWGLMNGYKALNDRYWVLISILDIKMMEKITSNFVHLQTILEELTS